MKYVHQAGGSLESEHGGTKVGSLKLESRKWDTRGKGELIRTGYSREKSWDLKNNFLWPLLDFFFPQSKDTWLSPQTPTDNNWSFRSV